MTCVTLLVLVALGSMAGAEEMRIEGAQRLRTGAFEGAELGQDGRITLKRATAPSVDGEPLYLTFGTYTYGMALPAGSRVSQVALLSPDMPPEEKSRFEWTQWPSVATDLIIQARFLQPNGQWTPWQPRNLLAGGDFADQNRNGIPDWTSVFQHGRRSTSDAIFADVPIIGCPPPPRSWWHGKNRPPPGDFMDAGDVPTGALQALRLTRHTHEGQDTAEMCKDLVPPDAPLTVSGWNRYDIGSQTSMGVMARFHEFDADGHRVNKYVLLGDDDFHQPSGRSGWRWRALTFTPMPTTVRLGLYPIRMITAQGRAWAANWEVREEAVYSEWGSPKSIFREDFRSLDRWDLSHPASTALAQSGHLTSHSLVMTPPPLTVATAVQKELIPVQEGKLYALRIAMRNEVPAKYDQTHDTWVSCYLEFWDENGRFLDYVKAMAFRPVLERPVGAAMHAPPGSKGARFRLVASHITYADRRKITETMAASFSALQLEESAYDPTFAPRPAQPHIAFPVPVPAMRMEVRSLLLSRDRRVTPSFSGYGITLVERP